MDSQGRYVKREEICKVGNKTVFKAIDRSLGSNVALFEWDLSHIPENAREKEIKKFISRLVLVSKIKSEYLLAMNCDSETPFIVNPPRTSVTGFGEIMGITLKGFLYKARSVSVATINAWAFQILKGLEFLHTSDPTIILRNLKLENIFYDAKAARLKIGDLCEAKLVNGRLPKNPKGDVNRRAPEMIQKIPYDTKVDIWAFGLCLIEIATVVEPYDEFNGAKDKIKTAILNGLLPHALEKIQEPVHMLHAIGLCLAYEPKMRPTATQLLNQFFLKTVQRDLFVSLREFTQADAEALHQRTRGEWEALCQRSLQTEASPEGTPTPPTPEPIRLNSSATIEPDVILTETDFFPAQSPTLSPTTSPISITGQRTLHSSLQPRTRVSSVGSTTGSPPLSTRQLLKESADVILGDDLHESSDRTPEYSKTPESRGDSLTQYATEKRFSRNLLRSSEIPRNQTDEVLVFRSESRQKTQITESPTPTKQTRIDQLETSDKILILSPTKNPTDTPKNQKPTDGAESPLPRTPRGLSPTIIQLDSEHHDDQVLIFKARESEPEEKPDQVLLFKTDNALPTHEGASGLVNTDTPNKQPPEYSPVRLIYTEGPKSPNGKMARNSDSHVSRERCSASSRKTGKNEGSRPLFASSDPQRQTSHDRNGKSPPISEPIKFISVNQPNPSAPQSWDTWGKGAGLNGGHTLDRTMPLCSTPELTSSVDDEDEWTKKFNSQLQSFAAGKGSTHHF